MNVYLLHVMFTGGKDVKDTMKQGFKETRIQGNNV